MPISYDGLWKLMEERGVSQGELAKACGIADNSITRMRKGEYLSMETIDKICNYFGCDYGDIMTRAVKADNVQNYIAQEDKRDEILSATRRALVKYMEQNGMTVAQVHEVTELSINTIKSFLTGEAISSISFTKLCRLGDGYLSLVTKEAKINSGANTIVRIPARKMTKVSGYIFYKLLCQVPSGRITRSDDILAFVSKAKGYEYIEIDYADAYTLSWKATRLLDIPYWREVSTRGMLMDTFDCSKERQRMMLEREGLTVIECGANKASLGVENYKNLLFDFEHELKVGFSEIEKLE